MTASTKAPATDAIDPTAPIVRARGVEKRFVEGGGRGEAALDVRVLAGVDLDVRRGEAVAVVGASGSGKSTLLHLLGGLERPTAGTVEVAGRDVQSLGQTALGAWRNRHLGFVYQFHHLLPEFTAEDNVAMPLRVRRQPVDTARFEAAAMLGRVGLAERTRHRPSELSGGERQRTAIARALANGPRILLMDEPFGALDHQTRELMQELLLGIWEAEKKTVLFVTHDIDEAVFMGSRVVVMSARPGRIKLDREVPIAHPRHYSVKTTPAFSELKAELMEQVRVEVRAAQALESGPA